ncbi:hypothetical protein KFU94_56955 [Chloroflexi bacterium TSY]|nr:hypothetical protein [Chloroflexi bacterium TSY]
MKIQITNKIQHKKFAIHIALIGLLALLGLGRYLAHLVTVSASLATVQRGASAPAIMAQTSSDVMVAGTYHGFVRVDEPAPLGALELVFHAVNDSNTLSGQVDNVRTQVFLGGPSLVGSVTASAPITPTFELTSEEFESEISGRTVRRRFTLSGYALEGGDQLKGIYTEVITGFKPQPMNVRGEFLVSRPSGVTSIISPPTPSDRVTPTATSPGPESSPTATPTPQRPGTVATPTPTATTPGSRYDRHIFLPLIAVSPFERQGTVLNASLHENRSASVRVVATPLPPVPAADSDLQKQYSIYLPLIGQ